MWAARPLERKRPKVVAVALANNTARIAWALMVLRVDDKPVGTGDRDNPGRQSTIECEKLIGIRSADFIKASGHEYRADRPYTWLHRPACLTNFSLAPQGPSTHESNPTSEVAGLA